MRDYQYSLEIIQQELKNKYICPEVKYAFETSIQALEKQICFENTVCTIRDWFVNNKNCLLDAAIRVSRKEFELIHRNGFIDDVGLDSIIEEIVDEIQIGILNVLSTFKAE